MNSRSKLILVVSGLWVAATPVILTKAEQSAVTNSTTTAPAPPLPPVPRPLPASAQRFTNRLQRLPTVPAAARETNFTPSPGQPPLAALVALTNRPVLQPLPLIADCDLKEYTAKPGETNALFTFTLTNTSPADVTVNEVHTSCGCTVAKLPSQPWILTPGTSGQIHVTVDLRGKRGQITKLVYVNGATGNKTLTVKVTIPEVQPGIMANRDKNREIATADRQAVFRNECAACHVASTVGKQGEALYAAGCAICHDSEHRASMVPDLHHLSHSTDRTYWKVWTTHGKEGSLMPAFARAEGGPLTDDQINSLADYLAEHIPSLPAAGPVTPSAKPPVPQ
jgi:mono/diheme cytochrome c family protein